jgi:hypothetical protein
MLLILCTLQPFNTFTLQPSKIDTLMLLFLGALQPFNVDTVLPLNLQTPVRLGGHFASQTWHTILGGQARKASDIGVWERSEDQTQQRRHKVFWSGG